MIKWLKRKILCKLLKHDYEKTEVFVVEKTIPLGYPYGDNVIDGSQPDAIKEIAKRYKDYGHLDEMFYCKRCGETAWRF